MSKHHKQFPPQITVSTGKNLPNVDKNIKNIEAKHFKWRILPTHLDFENGSFGWSSLKANQILLEIIPKLHKFEELNWSEAYKRKHFHPMKVSNLSSKLRKLAEQKDYDCLYQIDISDSCRIFGIKDRDVFFCVWYDSNHNGKKMS